MDESKNHDDSGNARSSGKNVPENGDSGRGSIIKKFLFIITGITASLLWITLFVAGLLVDSSYYRAAVNFHYATIADWFLVITTFTLSNVCLLAFLAGLIGGICSKLIATKGFTLNPGKIPERDYLKIENPFISAMRGIFVFVAILSMQYLSSFSDLGSISQGTGQNQEIAKIYDENLYFELSQQIKDTADLKRVIKWMKREADDMEKGTDSLVNEIIMLKDSMTNLQKLSVSDKIKIQKLKQKIKTLRRSVKVPANVDFSSIGISSFAYFKFAVIVSFLAFVFGYNPSRFTDFISKFLGQSGGKNDQDKKEKK